MNHNMKLSDSSKDTVVNQEQKENQQPDNPYLKNFIPSGINPDNGKFFEGNHNPLSSKGE